MKWGERMDIWKELQDEGIDAALLEDFRGRSLIAYSGEWPVGYLLKHNPGLELSESLSE